MKSISGEQNHEIKALETKYIDLVRARLGIDIHSHQINEFFKTIHDGCTKFKLNPQQYLEIISTCPIQSPYLEHLVSGITVGETYFFRDKNQMEILEKNILPQLISEKRQQNNYIIRIWSAGCSTGEEIYTIGILLKELIPDIEKWTVKLLATDINMKALQKAIKAHYSDWSMRAISQFYLQRYFQVENRHFILNQTIRDLVNFDFLNLNENNFPSIYNGTNAQDLILCRNVLIYFDNRHVANLMKKLYSCLIPGGYLILGASDPINMSETHFIYQQTKAGVFTKPIQDLIVKNTSIKTESIPVKKITPEKKNYNYKLEIPTKTITQPIRKLSSAELNAKAVDLANQGQLEQAKKLCEESLTLDLTDKFTYLTYAVTLTELNQLSAAEKALRTSLFIDNNFVIAHFQLGLLLLRKKQNHTGLKALQNALKIAVSQESSQSVPGSQDLSYGKLAEILRKEIDLYATLGNDYAEYK